MANRKPIITDHGSLRVRKRSGAAKSSALKRFEDALHKGRRQSDFKGRFRKYLDAMAIKHNAKPIVYGGQIYWSKNNVLITVYNIPGRYSKYLAKK